MKWDRPQSFYQPINFAANLNMGRRTCLCYQCAIKQRFFLDGRQPLRENAENTTVVDGFLVARLVGNQSSVFSEMCLFPWFNGKNCGLCWLLQFRHSFHELTHWTQNDLNVCFQLFSLVCTHYCLSFMHVDTRLFFDACNTPCLIHVCGRLHCIRKRKCIRLAEFPGSSFLTSTHHQTRSHFIKIRDVQIEGLEFIFHRPLRHVNKFHFKKETTCFKKKSTQTSWNNLIHHVFNVSLSAEKKTAINLEPIRGCSSPSKTLYKSVRNMRLSKNSSLVEQGPPCHSWKICKFKWNAVPMI